MPGLYDYLYAHPSFVEGFARLWDFSGPLNVYDDSETIIEANAIAMWTDWASIGLDIDTASNEYREEVLALS